MSLRSESFNETPDYEQMKFCIYGAGAIGGYLGFMLSEAGFEVTLIDHGAHYEAIRDNGLTLHLNGEARTRSIPCTDNPASLPPQDYIFIAVKTYAVPEILEHLPGLLHGETALVNVNNGIPWWYFYAEQGEQDKTYLESVDPGGQQWQRIGPERAIGCVVYPACQLTAPGVIEHISGNRFALGEPSGEKSDRVLQLAQVMRQSRIKVSVKTRIRDEVWIKLLGNLAFNPISVLTHATLRQICQQAGTRELARDMMLEAQAVAESLGIKFSIDVEQRINGAEAVGDHKTSMLQDYAAGYPLETDALLTAVQELGALTGHRTTTIDRILALVNLKVQSREIAPAECAAR